MRIIPGSLPNDSVCKQYEGHYGTIIRIQNGKYPYKLDIENESTATRILDFCDSELELISPKRIERLQEPRYFTDNMLPKVVMLSTEEIANKVNELVDAHNSSVGEEEEMNKKIAGCNDFIHGTERISYHDWNMRESGKCFCGIGEGEKPKDWEKEFDNRWYLHDYNKLHETFTTVGEDVKAFIRKLLEERS